MARQKHSLAPRSGSLATCASAVLLLSSNPVAAATTIFDQAAEQTLRRAMAGTASGADVELRPSAGLTLSKPPVQTPPRPVPQPAAALAMPRLITPPAMRPVTAPSVRSFVDRPVREALPEAPAKPVLASENLDVLRQIVVAALQRAPAIEQASADVRAAELDIAEARGQRWPTVDVTGGTRPAQFGSGANNGVVTAGNQVGISSTTSVFDWGRLGYQIGGRQKLYDAAVSKLRQTREAVSVEVLNSALNVAKFEGQVRMGDLYAERLRGLVDMLSEIVKVDRGRASELTQARSRLLQAEAARDAAKAKLREFEVSLRRLTGDEQIARGRLSREISMGNFALDEAIAMIPRHPAIMQAESEAGAQEMAANALKAGLNPGLNLVISKSTGLDALGRVSPWQAYLALQWSAFRGMAGVSAERAARERAESARQKREQAIIDLEGRIRAASQDYGTQLDRSRAFRELAVETDKVRENYFEQWHKLGRRSLLEVLIAENEHFTTITSEEASLFDAYIAQARMRGESGRLVGWLLPDLGDHPSENTPAEAAPVAPSLGTVIESIMPGRAKPLAAPLTAPVTAPVAVPVSDKGKAPEPVRVESPAPLRASNGLDESVGSRATAERAWGEPVAPVVRPNVKVEPVAPQSTPSVPANIEQSALPTASQATTASDKSSINLPVSDKTQTEVTPKRTLFDRLRGLIPGRKAHEPEPGNKSAEPVKQDAPVDSAEALKPVVTGKAMEAAKVVDAVKPSEIFRPIRVVKPVEVLSSPEPVKPSPAPKPADVPQSVSVAAPIVERPQSRPVPTLFGQPVTPIVPVIVPTPTPTPTPTGPIIAAPPAVPEAAPVVSSDRVWYPVERGEVQRPVKAASGAEPARDGRVWYPGETPQPEAATPTRGSWLERVIERVTPSR